MFLLGYYGDADPEESDMTSSSLLMLAAQKVASVDHRDRGLCGGKVFRPKRFHGIHAYVVTREGAKKLLKHCNPVAGTPDITISNANATGHVRVLAARPSLIRQDESGSSQTSKQPYFLDWAFRDSWFPTISRGTEAGRLSVEVCRVPADGVPGGSWTMLLGIGSFAAGTTFRSCTVALLWSLVVCGLLLADGLVLAARLLFRTWRSTLALVVLPLWRVVTLRVFLFPRNGGPEIEAEAGGGGAGEGTKLEGFQD